MTGDAAVNRDAPISAGKIWRIGTMGYAARKTNVLRCLSLEAMGYQVTVKLTVDSRYKEQTPIQVEVSSNEGQFPREGSASCTDIGVLAPNSDALRTPVPVIP